MPYFCVIIELIFMSMCDFANFFQYTLNEEQPIYLYPLTMMGYLRILRLHDNVFPVILFNIMSIPLNVFEQKKFQLKAVTIVEHDHIIEIKNTSNYLISLFVFINVFIFKYMK